MRVKDILSEFAELLQLISALMVLSNASSFFLLIFQLDVGRSLMPSTLQNYNKRKEILPFVLMQEKKLYPHKIFKAKVFVSQQIFDYENYFRKFRVARRRQKFH